MKTIKSVTCTVMIGLVLMAQFMNPTRAYADGETPPSTKEPTEVVTTDLKPDKPGVDLIPTGLPQIETDDPVETAMPPPPASPDKPLEQAVSTPEPIEPAPSQVILSPRVPSLGDVIRDLPENTGVMVLDDIGKPLPLASQEAAQVIASSDPVWCPAGQAPTPGANGCTISYLTLADLVANEGASIAANGTIWITTGPVADSNPILIDGSIYTNWSNHTLTLQGGWDGVAGSTTISSNSTFTSPIAISAWIGDVTINSITIQNTTSTGLAVDTQGTITASNITANGNAGGGAELIGTSGVTVTGTNEFNNNGGDAVLAATIAGDITLSNITANGNRWNGAYLYSRSGNITLTGTNQFNNNGQYGVYAEAAGNITLNNVTANVNRWDGAGLHGDSGNITLTGTNQFNNNGQYGVWALTYEDIILNNVTANGNGEIGAQFVSYSSNITLTGTNEFNNNGVLGLWADANGQVTLEGTNTFNNGFQGLRASSLTAAITLNNVTATANGTLLYDVDVSLFTSGNVTINHATVGALDAAAVCGTLALNQVSAANIIYPVSGEHILLGPDGNQIRIYCTPQVYVDGRLLGALPAVTPTQYEFDLSCDSQTLYPVDLPNGDKVTIVCPVQGRALISRLDNTTIPNDLPAGYTYASAFSVAILQDDEPIPVITEGGHVEVSFQVPSQQAGSYSILFWDNGTWVPLSDFILGPDNGPQSFQLNPGAAIDLRTILSGVQLVTRNGVQRVEVFTNFPGIFALAQH